MNFTELLIGGIGILSTAVSAWLSWFFTRKKYNSEVDHNIIHNMLESLDFYKKLVDDNTSRLDDVLKRNQELEATLDELRNKNNDLENEISVLRKQMFDVMSNICMDLSCSLRMRELTKKRVKKNEEA